jgi:hypothetical protein
MNIWKVICALTLCLTCVRHGVLHLTHPAMTMEMTTERAGLNGSVQADNRLISVLPQGRELQAMHEVCGLGL